MESLAEVRYPLPLIPLIFVGLALTHDAAPPPPPPPTCCVYVGPDGGATSVFPNTSGSTSFSITGLQSGQSYSWTFSCSGYLSNCVSAPGNPASTFTATAYGATVTINFSVAHPWTGRVTVKAWGNSVPGSDSGWYNIILNGYGPVVSTLPTNGDYRDVSKCVANCFDGVFGYTAASYVSADVPRAVSLIYRSDQARPLGLVQLDARDTSTVNPVKMSLQLYRSDGTRVLFINNSFELFFNWTSHPADGNVNRLAAQFNAGGLSSGAYNYVAVARSYRSDGSFRETAVPLRLLIVNESGSPFGVGWSIVGYQHVYGTSDGGIAITEGNGSIAYFAPGQTTCFQGLCTTYFTSPRGDFTTLVKKTGGTCTPPPCATYERTYVSGSIVGFDASGKLLALGGYLQYYKDARFANSMDEVRHLPWSVTYISRATFGYNASNQLVAITDSAGKADSLGYDANNRLRWIKDPGGRVDSITVDVSGNLTAIKDWGATIGNGATIGQGGRPHEFQYDVYHRMIRWTDRRGIAWNRAYDFASKIAGDTAPQVRVNGQLVRPVTRYASMEKGMLIDSASGLGTSANPGPDIDTVVIRATTTNPRGYPTTYALDRFGAPTLIQEPLGRTTAYTRDTNSAVVQSTLPSGHVIQYTWTGPDLVRVLDATTGRKDTMTYVSHHLAIHAGDVDSVVNYWTINATRVTLDSTHTGGAGMVRFSYTAGRLCRIVDAAGHASQCYFTSTSGFQNTDSIRYALGVVGYRYDGHGQRVMTINQVHDTVKAVYDSLGRIVRTIGGVHDTTTSVYDDSLHVTQLQDAKGQVYRSWFNAVGWVDSTADAASQKDRFQFDSSGHPVGWTNRNGRVITAVYDSLDQKRSVTADGRTATLFTDPAGHFVMTNNGESIDTVRMDAGDRAAVAVSCRVLVNGNAAKCFRDSAIYEMPDIQTHLALFAPEVWANTDTFKVHDHYDVHRLRDYLTPGYVSGQPAPLSILFTHNSEALDSVTTFGPLNNLTMTHSYPWNHVTDQIQFSDPALDGVLGTAANFDSAGRLRTRYHGSLTDPDTARSFTYDRQGNLMQYNDTLHHYTQHCNYSWQTGGFYCNNTDQPTFLDSTTYAYDSVANRKDPAGLIVLDPGNRLRRWQNFRMDYDLVGNLTAKRTLNPVDSTQLLRTDSLFWSTLGTLDSVRTRDGSGVLIGRVGFGYDGMGRRVRKSGGGGTTRYVWDGESLLAELDTLGQLVAGYTDYGLDEIASVLRRDRVDSTYYYVQDYSRNVVAILARTAGGNVIDNQYRYEPFGTLQGNTSAPIPNSRQFAGREYDAETQLYYDRARYLDPTLGRFVSEDPIGLNGGINLYGFVGNDPINGWDPSGTSCKRWSLRQELFRDKAIHFFIGLGLVERWQDHGILKVFKPLLRDASPWGPVHQAWEIGLLHEGPWGIRTPIPGLVFGDHDLTDARGAPCAGWFDIAWFMLVPMINYVMKEGWPWQPTQDMIDGGSPPWWDPAPRMPRRPTSMPPGMGTPGWPVL